MANSFEDSSRFPCIVWDSRHNDANEMSAISLGTSFFGDSRLDLLGESSADAACKHERWRPSEVQRKRISMLGKNKGQPKPPKRRSTKSSFESTVTSDILSALSGELSSASKFVALRVQKELSLAPPALTPSDSLERFQEKSPPIVPPTPPKRRGSAPSLDSDDDSTDVDRDDSTLDIAFLLKSLPLDTIHSDRSVR